MKLSDNYEDVIASRQSRDKTVRKLDDRTPLHKLQDRVFLAVVWGVLALLFAGLAGWLGR